MQENKYAYLNGDFLSKESLQPVMFRPHDTPEYFEFTSNLYVPWPASTTDY